MKKKIIPFSASGSYNAGMERKRNVIGKKIAAVRKNRGLTLGDLSALLEASGLKGAKVTIGKWEIGNTIPSAYQTRAIFNALGVADGFAYFMPMLDSVSLRELEDYRDDLIASAVFCPLPVISDPDYLR